jgi:hypothetical protein
MIVNGTAVTATSGPFAIWANLQRADSLVGNDRTPLQQGFGFDQKRPALGILGPGLCLQ